MTVEEEDLVEIDYLQIIDSQLSVISNLLEYPDDLYDNIQTDKIRSTTLAFKIINKIQKNILDSL